MRCRERVHSLAQGHYEEAKPCRCLPCLTGATARLTLQVTAIEAAKISSMRLVQIVYISFACWSCMQRCGLLLCFVLASARAEVQYFRKLSRSPIVVDLGFIDRLASSLHLKVYTLRPALTSGALSGEHIVTLRFWGACSVLS